MKNLKKSLALVLAVVMVFSLCVIANAEYTDQDAIGAKYQTAVGVMSGIGVIAGDDTGKLAPQGNFTREQACKIIAYMKLGTAAASKLSTGVAPFDDVAATRWSAPYVAYCVNAGIVNGYGDGNFGPTDVLTGYQWAKMLLCALGYGVNGEYTGDAWQIAVAKDALPLGVFKGDTDGATSEPITREQAILFAFNTLTNIPEVDYSAYIGKYVIKGTSYGGTSTSTTYLSDNFNLGVIRSAVILANADTNKYLLTKYGPKTEFDYAYLNGNYVVDLDGAVDASLYYASAAADVGHMGDVYYNMITKSVYFFDDFTKVVNFTRADTAATFAAGLFDLDVENGSEILYTLKDNVLLRRDGAVATPNPADVVLPIIFGTTSPNTLGGYTFYVAKGQIVAMVLTGSVTVDKVNKVTTTAANESITLAGIGVLANSRYNDQVNEYEGIAKGDIVIVSRNTTDNTAGVVYTLTKATTVEGKISGLSLTYGAESITLTDGTKLSKTKATLVDAQAAGVDGHGFEDNTGLAINLATLAYNNTYVFYLDNAGAVIGWTTKTVAVDPSAMVFVTNTYAVTAKNPYGADVTTNYAQGVTVEGKEVNLKIAALPQHTEGEGEDAVIVSDEDEYINKLYTYYTDAYGNAVLTALNTNQANALELAQYGTTTAADAATPVVVNTKSFNIGNAYYTDDVKVIAISAGYTADGTDAPVAVRATVTNGKVDMVEDTYFAVYSTPVVAGSANFVARYVFINKSAAVADSASYIFAKETAASVSSVQYTTARGTTSIAYAHSVYIDGVPATIYVDQGVSDAGAAAITGFKNFKVIKGGSIDIYEIGTAASNTIAEGTIQSNFNGIIATTASGGAKNASGATVINTFNPYTQADLYENCPTTVDELVPGWKITCKTNAYGVITAIYVVGYTA